MPNDDIKNLLNKLSYEELVDLLFKEKAENLKLKEELKKIEGESNA